MVYGMLTEIDILEKSEFNYLSFDQLNKNKSFGENDELFFKTFEEISKITRKTRLKVNEGWTDKLLEVTQSEKMIDLVNENTKKLNKTELKDIEGGILISEKELIYVIKIYDKWYELPTNKKPIEILKGIIDERLAKFIWYNIKRSIIILKSVKSWKETERKFEPIKIVLNK
jgi:hypothetical protein